MALRDNIRRVVPYTPGEQPKEKVIKLNTNECPYPPSEKVIKALREADYDRLRLYPDPACTGFISALSEYYGVDENKIFAGVGSDDVLSMCFLTFFNGNKPVLFPDITYSFYDVWAEVYRIPYRQIPLREDFTIDPKDYRAENGGIVIANPNAPTGIAEKRETIETIIRDNPESVVIVDEAYVDFGGETVLDLIDKYSNLVVVRTMSKSRAMAGMRLGYAFGDAELIKYLNDVKFSVNSYTLNMPSLIAGEAAIRDRGYFEEITEKVKATRERVKKELKDSKTVLAKAEALPGADKKACEELKKKIDEKSGAGGLFGGVEDKSDGKELTPAKGKASAPAAKSDNDDDDEPNEEEG